MGIVVQYPKSSPFLVTGAAGFTGQYLVQFLRSRKIPVRALVRSSNIPEALKVSGVEVVEGDLKDESSIRAAVQGVAGVYHIAALFRQAGLPDSEYRDVNVGGTRRLLEASIQAGIPRFVHCSTIGVLGDIEDPPATEEYRFGPGDIYQQTKMEAELLVRESLAKGDISGVVIRPAMIYGPGDQRTLKLFKMIAKKQFFYVGKGDKHVHWIDVRDLVRSFWQAMEATHLNNEVFIIAGKRALPLKSFAQIVAKESNVPEPWIHLPVRPMQWLGSACEAVCTPLRINPPIFRRRVDFFTKSRWFDTTKAQTMLGFVPSQEIEGEVRDILRWYRENGMLPQQKSGRVTIVRSIEGTIVEWDGAAEQAYGWGTAAVVGKVSHQVLKTEFPIPLEEINKKLLEDGHWQGNLFHVRRDGRRINVVSRWELQHSDNQEDARVIEINRPQDHVIQEEPQRSVGLQHVVGSVVASVGEVLTAVA